MFFLHGDKMEVLYSNKQYQLLKKTDTRLDSEYLVLVGVLENGDMVLMRTGGGKHPGKCGNFEQISSVCRGSCHCGKYPGGIFHDKTYYETIAAADGYFQADGGFGFQCKI